MLSTWGNSTGGSATGGRAPTLALYFTTSAYYLNGNGYAFASIPGVSVVRASTGYAATTAGVLVSFGTNVARITDQGLLVEEARTNLALQSQTFSNASWSKNNCSVTANAATDPTGANNAWKIVEDSTTNFHGVSQLLTLVSGTTYTQQIIVKAAERSWLQMTEANNVTAAAWFNLATGTVGAVNGTGSPSARMRPLGTTGWYVCELTFTPVANAGNIQARPTTGDGVSSYAGNGSSGIYVWNGDMQAGAFGTSPIVTTSASATRAADVVSIGGLSGTSVGTLISDVDFPNSSTGTAQTILAVSDGSFNNRVNMFRPASNSNADFRVVTGGVAASPSVVANVLTTGRHKIAVAYAAGRAQQAVDGALGTGSAPASISTGMSTLSLGVSETLSGNQVNAYLRTAILCPTAFTNAQLQQVNA